jgi:hypothetical protein
VNPNSGVDARLALGEREDGIRAGEIDRRHEDSLYAGQASPFDHCRPVVIKVGEIEMAMCVYEQGRRAPARQV